MPCFPALALIDRAYSVLRENQSRVSSRLTLLSGPCGVNKRVQNIGKTLMAIDGLLQRSFLSLSTRAQLQTLKAGLEAELRSILAQQGDVAAAG